MSTIQGVNQSYISPQYVQQTYAAPRRQAVSDQDRYISGTASNDISVEKPRKLTQAQTEAFAEKFDLRNMDRSQYTKILAELRNAGVISEQEFSIGYAGALPKQEEAPTWPQNAEKADFIQLLNRCAAHCEALSASSSGTDSKMLAAAYSRLSAVFAQIDDAGKQTELADAEVPDAENDPAAPDPLAEQYSRKALELYEKLKQDTSYTSSRDRRCFENDTARALATEILLTDDDMMSTFAKDLWTQLSKREASLKGTQWEAHWKRKVGKLPADYTGMADKIRGILLAGSRDEVGEIMSEFDGFLSSKAKREHLTDVERLLSSSAEAHEKATWQNFDARMEPVRDAIEQGFDEAGFSFDVDKTYRFYLDTKTFTFSVTGGDDHENELIAKIINSHPRENYKFDPLHTSLMALYGSRREDLSYNPWQADRLPDRYKSELLERYGVAGDVPDSYSKKMKQFIAAYQLSEIDNGLKLKYGFGVNDITYVNGTFVGKTTEITERINSMGFEFMNETGYAYLRTLNSYTGTPEFEEAVFVFEQGKFKITYGQ